MKVLDVTSASTRVEAVASRGTRVEESIIARAGLNVGEGGEAHAVLEDVRELHGAVKGERAGERDAELLHHHAEERHHGDAAVLDLDRAAAGEALLVLPHEA